MMQVIIFYNFVSSTTWFADIESEAHDTSNNVGHVSTTSPQKRKSENVVDGEPTEKKKFAMNFNMKKNTDGLKKIPINIGSNLKLGAIPIKMSLSSQVRKTNRTGNRIFPYLMEKSQPE